MKLDCSSRESEGRSRNYLRLLTSVFFAIAASAGAASITANPSVSSPAPVGELISWQASAGFESAGPVWYRWRVRGPGEARFRVVRDFSPADSFDWMPALREGWYEVEITARNRDTGETEIAVFPYEIVSRARTGEPAISSTANRLVYLYSAPPCPQGSRIHVRFTDGNGNSRQTPAEECSGGTGVHLYLAGLRPETAYVATHTVVGPDGVAVEGPPTPFQTEALPWSIPPTRSLLRPEEPAEDGILFQNRVFGMSVATDLEGNVIWYYPQVVPYLTRPERGGFFFALIEKHGGADEEQILRQVDLAGHTVWETNAARINEQLAAMGRRPITSFHHEARRLPNGDILVLAATERMISDVQGSGPVAVIGDAILTLNRDLEVRWFWDSFDHLDVSRPALLDEKCIADQGGCPVFRLASVGNDWLHGNSLAYTSDGNIIYSSRHQGWIVKIHYGDGYGSGEVIWRLGAEGDFQVASDDPVPWFSHQHDANFVPCPEGQCLLLFDNGNMRAATDPDARSRGQLFHLDEISRNARLLLNVDLGGYAFALGSAQRLPNGNYHFNLGWTPAGWSEALEYSPDGQLVRRLEAETQVYRSERMRDLYTPY